MTSRRGAWLLAAGRASLGVVGTVAIAGTASKVGFYLAHKLAHA